jgi:hypothetical protein
MHRTLSLADAPTVSVVDGTLEWIPVRRTLGIRAFGTNAYRADAGHDVIERHNEGTGHEEMYVVIAGRARFEIGDDVVDAAAGTVVFLPKPNVERYARAEEDGTIVLGVGGWPDKPYKPSPWEPLFMAHEAGRQGHHAEAIAIIEREADIEQLESAAVQYTLACHRAQIGDTGSAILHLRAANSMDPDKVRRWAETDTDLDPLRDLPDWPL